MTNARFEGVGLCGSSTVECMRSLTCRVGVFSGEAAIVLHSTDCGIRDIVAFLKKTAVACA